MEETYVCIHLMRIRNSLVDMYRMLNLQRHFCIYIVPCKDHRINLHYHQHYMHTTDNLSSSQYPNIHARNDRKFFQLHEHGIYIDHFFDHKYDQWNQQYDNYNLEMEKKYD